MEYWGLGMVVLGGGDAYSGEINLLMDTCSKRFLSGE